MTALADALVSLVTEYEGRESPEAIRVRDADKLGCLLQAREYLATGHEDVPPWIETSAEAVRSVSGKRLAELCQRVAPKDWWAAAAAAYPHPQRPLRAG